MLDKQLKEGFKDNYEEVREEARFTRKNNLIDEGHWEEPPKTVNADGSAYYGPKDPRNTHDPWAKRVGEDFDGEIKEFQSGGVIEVPDVADDMDDPINGEEASKEHIEGLREVWQKHNLGKTINFQDFVKLNPPAYGIE